MLASAALTLSASVTNPPQNGPKWHGVSRSKRQRNPRSRRPRHSQCARLERSRRRANVDRWLLGLAGAPWRRPVCHQAAALGLAPRGRTACRSFPTSTIRGTATRPQPSTRCPAPLASPTAARSISRCDPSPSPQNSTHSCSPIRSLRRCGSSTISATSPRIGHRERSIVRHQSRRHRLRRSRLYPRYLRLVGRQRHALASLPRQSRHGSHSDPARSFETWGLVFGPSHYAFQYGGATFIVLNNVERLPRDRPTASGHNYRGAIGARPAGIRAQSAGARAARSTRRPFHAYSARRARGSARSCRHDASTGSNCCGCCPGVPHLEFRRPHAHDRAPLSRRGAWLLRPWAHHHHVLTAACGSWWSGPFDQLRPPIADSRDGTPKGFHILSVDGNSYTTRFVGTGSPDGSRLRVMIEASGAATPRASTDSSGSSGSAAWSMCSAADVARASLVVNVFDGGPRTKVSYEIKAVTTSPVAMQRNSACDPFIVETFRRHKQELKPWVIPEPPRICGAPACQPILGPAPMASASTSTTDIGRPSQTETLIEILA